MKAIVFLVLLTPLPLLTGCFSMMAVQAANGRQTGVVESVNKIEKAGVTKDDQLHVWFEKDLTNSTQGRFEVVIPIAQIRAHARPSSTGSWATFDMSQPSVHMGEPEKPRSDIIPVPVGAPLNLIPMDFALSRLEVTLQSNSTRTIYLSRAQPIEFIYLDKSVERPWTLVRLVMPVVLSERQPGYYAWLPLTVPVDAGLLPLEALGGGFMWLAMAGLGSTP